MILQSFLFQFKLLIFPYFDVLNSVNFELIKKIFRTAFIQIQVYFLGQIIDFLLILTLLLSPTFKTVSYQFFIIFQA